MKWLVFVVSALFVTGCGGSGALLPNSRASVTVWSSAVSDLEIIVSPKSGDAGVIDACDLNSDGFGCNRYFKGDEINYRFDTSSESSSSPFFVYLKNTSPSPVRYRFQVLLNEEEKVYFTDTAPAHSTIRIARIFRYSADDI